MMKKLINENKKIIAFFLCALVVSNLYACSLQKKDDKAKGQDVQVNTDEEKLLTSVIEQMTNGEDEIKKDPIKEEIVYVMSDAKGEVTKVIVNDTLKNIAGEKEVSDISSLKDIDNVKGHETYETDDAGNMTWKTNGKDITYQGKSSSNPPVSMNVSYFLDGKAVEPDALLGKSGKVTIRYEYVNHAKVTRTVNGHEYEVHVPFAMITGIALSNERFKNVEATNGNIMKQDDNSVVIGVAFPGLTESINIKKLKSENLSDETNEKIDDVDIPEFFEIKADVKDFQLGETITFAMPDFMNMLINDEDEDNEKDDEKDGDKVLGIDINSINESMDDLKDGSSAIKDGTKELHDGTSELYDGTSELDDGVKELDDGVKELYDGVIELDDGVKELFDGTDKLNNGVRELHNGTEGLDDAAGQILDGIYGLDGGISQLQGGAKGLFEGATQLKESLSNSGNLGRGGVPDVSKLFGDISSKLVTEEPQEKDYPDNINDYYKALGKYELSKEIEGKLDPLPSTFSRDSSNMEQLTQLIDGVIELCNGIEQLYGGIGELKSGSSVLLDGMKEFKKGTGSLKDGTKELKDGTQEFAEGVVELKNGTTELRDGVKELKDGTGELKDGTGELNDGVKALLDGTKELLDGVTEFDEEGIKKLTDLFGDNVQGVMEAMQATIDAGNDYKIFTNVSEGMDSSVKFIYTTEAIK